MDVPSLLDPVSLVAGGAATLFLFLFFGLSLSRRGTTDVALSDAQEPVNQPEFTTIDIRGDTVEATGDLKKFQDAPLSSLKDLLAWADAADTSLGDNLRRLVQDGAPFHTIIPSEDDNWMRLEGQTKGLVATVTMGPAHPLEAELVTTIEGLKADLTRSEPMAERAAAHPVAAFETTQDGDIVWSNRAARQLLEIGQSRGTLRAQVPAPSDDLVRLVCDGGHSLGWARVETAPLSNGNMLVTVQDADREHRAQDTLASFSAILTETFAHLQVALAIFDRSGRLSLFNPALSDLLGVATGQLTARPDVEAFIDMFRSRQLLPESRSYPLWRKATIQRMRGSDETGFAEDWTIADGRVLRVSAQGHGGGGLALLIEDVSHAASVEKKYISELENGQAVLDSLAHGIAILGLSGEVIFANSAFESFWSLPEGVIEAQGLSLDRMLDRIEHGPTRADVPDRIRDFVTGSDRQATLDLDVATRNGDQIHLRLSPLPDGSTLLQGMAERIASDTVETRPVSAENPSPRIVAER